jgi:hypothetical protein
MSQRINVMLKSMKVKYNLRINNFGLAQIKIFIKIFKNINPKIILVANVFVSDIIKEVLSKEIYFNNDTDAHYLNSTPVFFSSMLTGRNPLDCHSRQRLVWHMKKLLIT